MNPISAAISQGELLSSTWKEIVARKKATREILANLPLKTKLLKLNAMRERQDQLRRFKPQLPSPGSH